MRILHILDHSLPLHSGYAFRSQYIFRAQAERGWQLTVLTSPKHQESWKGKWGLREIVEGLPHFRTPLSKPSSVQGYYEIRLVSALSKRMREVASTYRPDVIHAHSPVLNAIPALRVGRQLGIPVVYEIRAFWEDAAVDHGSYHEGSWKYRLVRLLETWVCRRAAHVITLCDGLRLDLIRRGIPAEKLSIVRNGISLEEFRECERDAELTKKYCLDGKKVIGYVGSFYRYEGLDLLLDAFALLGNRHKELVLLLVGGGEMHEALKERVRRLGWENRVHLPGRIPHDRVAGVYAAMDVLAYPRYSMRLTNLVTPLKPLEAMAMGKAVIASNIGGHRELIRDGETGILFPAGDAGALASAIERLLLDQNLRTAIARRGRDWVRQEHPWEKTTAIYRDVYARALKRD